MVNLKNIEYNLKPLQRTLEAFTAFDFAGIGDAGLAGAAGALRSRAAAGEPEEKLLPESFALTAEAVKRALGLVPHKKPAPGGRRHGAGRHHRACHRGRGRRLSPSSRRR